eukprot:scaffold23297_cov132-Cylindrotheca_fusiformis.AAC.10
MGQPCTRMALQYYCDDNLNSNDLQPGTMIMLQYPKEDEQDYKITDKLEKLSDRMVPHTVL